MRRLWTVGVLGILLAFALPSPAHAWHNGPAGGEGFGTHDWIVVQATRISASQGCTWVNLSVATRATNEPDLIKNDQLYHAYDRWGRQTFGKAPTKVDAMYRAAVAAYRAGDFDRASRYLGLLSHYYSDVCEPLHTDNLRAGSRVRRRYETAVDAMLVSPSNRPTWAKYDGYQRVSNAKTLAVKAASTAHRSYRTLSTQFSRKGFSPAVLTVTRGSLNRAVNGVADLEMSIEQDAVRMGVSPVVHAHQGVATDDDNFYLFHTTWIARYDRSWRLTGLTTTATADLPSLVRPHLGDGCYYNGKLYVPAENWPYPSSPYILVFDAKTLERLDAISIDTTEEVACVTIVPTEGSNGVLYVGSYYDGDHLSRYDLADFSRLEDLRLSPALPAGVQGLAFHDDAFYYAVGHRDEVGYLYTVARDGTARLRFIDRAGGTHEGVDFLNDDMLWLVDNGPPDRRVRFLRISAAKLP